MDSRYEEQPNLWLKPPVAVCIAIFSISARISAAPPSRIGYPGQLPIAHNQSMSANGMTFIRSPICSMCLTNPHALDFLESSDSS